MDHIFDAIAINLIDILVSKPGVFIIWTATMLTIGYCIGLTDRCKKDTKEKPSNEKFVSDTNKTNSRSRCFRCVSEN